jgi:AcrR family transcriptional regulator
VTAPARSTRARSGAPSRACSNTTSSERSSSGATSSGTAPGGKGLRGWPGNDREQASRGTARPVPAGDQRTQAERRAATEQRVLDAAVALTAERGVRAVTLATVGEKAGYSRGIVTHHFGSRALLDALVGRLQDAFRPPAASAGTGLDRLLALVDAYLVHLDAEPEIARAFLVLWVESLAAEPELRSAFADRDKRFPQRHRRRGARRDRRRDHHGGRRR